MTLPVSTYRIQFNKDLTFQKAEKILRYLRDLGVSHIYASPIFKAKKGSMHGYDVVDPNEINPELGGEEDFDKLIEQVRNLNMGWIQDIVPNHMAFDGENKLLMDVFEKGEASPFYDYFDINWSHPYSNLRGKALTPFLGDLYENCLKKGEIVVGIDKEGFHIKYYDLRLPVLLSSYPGILSGRPGFSRSETDEQLKIPENMGRITGIFTDLQIKDDKAVKAAIADLWRVYSDDMAFRGAIDATIDELNSGGAASLEELHRLISEQMYRLSFWKVGNDELNYRRFFTVNALICLRLEESYVFDFVHQKILDLVNAGKLDGLRLDHIDGLYSPAVYMRRLREKTGDIYIVAEKILSDNEVMPSSWPIQGTTGYDILNYINGLFVDNLAKRSMDRTYTSFSGMYLDFESLVVEKKKLFMGKHMAGDIDNLALLLKEVFSGNIYGSDLTMYGLRRALVEVMAHFPVYRTYSSELGISEADRFFIKQGFDRARKTGQDLLHELDAIEKILLADISLAMDDESKELCRQFTRRFQQFTGALMAKGAEDTAAYIYNRMVSLNEVGGFPESFGISVKKFHEFVEKRAHEWPCSMNTTATHDTKRGEDTRVRINALSELPEEWKNSLRSWHRANKKHKTKLDNEPAPGKNDEYLIYETLIGAFPFMPEDIEVFKERMKEFIVKAVREAKVHTAWLKPDDKYEKACVDFIDGILDGSAGNTFLSDFIVFQKKLARYGISNSLSQVLLKMTLPGVPDIYQGGELWDLNLVDPDNRRPVDFDKRQKYLTGIIENKGAPEDLIKQLSACPEDGRIKMFTIHRLLTARNERRRLFEEGEYIPLEARGRFADNIIAFARRKDSDVCISVATRFLSRLSKDGDIPPTGEAWRDTCISLPGDMPCRWKNIFTAKTISGESSILVSDILSEFPVGALFSEHRS